MSIWQYFYIPKRGRKYPHTNYNFTVTLISQGDHLTAEAWFACDWSRLVPHVFGERLEQLQNTPQLIYMSLNKNSVYCVMPRSSKPPDTCKWGGLKLRGILKFSRTIFSIDGMVTFTDDWSSRFASWQGFVILRPPEHVAHLNCSYVPL